MSNRLNKQARDLMASDPALKFAEAVRRVQSAGTPIPTDDLRTPGRFDRIAADHLTLRVGVDAITGKSVVPALGEGGRHVGIVGGCGTGKTVLLRTLLRAALDGASPEDLIVWVASDPCPMPDGMGNFVDLAEHECVTVVDREGFSGALADELSRRAKTRDRDRLPLLIAVADDMTSDHPAWEGVKQATAIGRELGVASWVCGIPDSIPSAVMVNLASVFLFSGMREASRVRYGLPTTLTYTVEMLQRGQTLMLTHREPVGVAIVDQGFLATRHSTLMTDEVRGTVQRIQRAP